MIAKEKKGKWDKKIDKKKILKNMQKTQMLQKSSGRIENLRTVQMAYRNRFLKFKH